MTSLASDRLGVLDPATGTVIARAPTVPGPTGVVVGASCRASGSDSASAQIARSAATKALPGRFDEADGDSLAGKDASLQLDDEPVHRGTARANHPLHAKRRVVAQMPNEKTVDAHPAEVAFYSELCGEMGRALGHEH